MWPRAHTTESGRLGAMFESQLGHTKDLKTCLALIDGRKGKLHMPCCHWPATSNIFYDNSHVTYSTERVESGAHRLFITV